MPDLDLVDVVRVFDFYVKTITFKVFDPVSAASATGTFVDGHGAIRVSGYGVLQHGFGSLQPEADGGGSDQKGHEAESGLSFHG